MSAVVGTGGVPGASGGRARGAATRRRLADAALEVLGEQGLRAMTHARVDAAAGVPRGTASNHYRTRDALVDGAVQRVVERERAVWDDFASSSANMRTGAPPGDRVGAVVEVVLVWLQRAAGQDRAMHVARYALMLEAARDPAVLRALRAGRSRTEAWVQDALRDCGARDPLTACRVLLTHLEGTLLHLVTAPGSDVEWAQVTSDLRGLVDSLLAAEPD